MFFYCNSEAKVNEVLTQAPKAQVYAWNGNHKPLVGLSGNYFIQGSYLTNGKSTNVSGAISDGMLVSINMLSATGSAVSEYDLNETYLDELLTIYPSVCMIQTDVPELLIEALAERRLR